jgi:hypothetical protein
MGEEQVRPDVEGPGEGAVARPPLAKLMEEVGFVLYYWSRLEEALVADIRRLRSESGGVQTSLYRVRGSSSERLAEWRALMSLKSRRNPALTAEVLEVTNEMERLRRKRNLIAHHFVDACAEGEEAEPFIVCVEGDRTGSDERSGRILQSELSAIIEEMDGCALRIRIIEASGAEEVRRPEGAA